MKRSAGILMPVSSLPSKYGIGCFDETAYRFIDWLKEAGQTYWQILPLVPTSYGDSPYQSFSTFAGNPYFISLDWLTGEGLLTAEETAAVDFGSKDDDIDYAKLYEGRYPLLRKAYERSHINDNGDFHRFVNENAWWLEDYALFMALKDFFGGKCWNEWPEDIKLRYGYAIEHYRNKLYFDIEFQKFLQYKFDCQWKDLKYYANSQGIQIVGDIPIYVAMDSADVWSHPELFQLDDKSNPIAVAGCPPDVFCETGQLWGNPLYDWPYHKHTKYAWWMERIAHCFKLYDVVRIDHFRGFESYYAIPYGDPTAEFGHWEKGPGYALFERMKEVLGERRVIAEDLGFLTDEVYELVAKTGYPGMKIIEFAFSDYQDNEYLPHNYKKNCIVYTGTHDNETAAGWLTNVTKEDHKFIKEYCDCHSGKELAKALVRLAMMSVADTAIIPIQDYLGLGNEARINEPSTLGTNWKWRLIPGQFTEETAEEMLELAKISFRY